MNKNKKTLIAAIVFVVIIAVFGGVYYFTRPDTQEGQKQVDIAVVNKEGEETAYEIHTDQNICLEQWRMQKRKA